MHVKRQTRAGDASRSSSHPKTSNLCATLTARNVQLRTSDSLVRSRPTVPQRNDGEFGLHQEITTRTLRKMGRFAGYCTISVLRISRNFAASAAIVNGFCKSAASVSKIP